MKKNILILFFLILIIIIILYNISKNEDGVEIISIGSGFETAYIEWKDETENRNITYKVYYKKDEDTKYKEIDSELVRNYKNEYWRADIVGLEKGKYQFKIISLMNNKKVSSVITKKIFVKPNIREGFCSSSGGYLNNGSVSKESKVIYITKENVNKVNLEITKENGEIEKIIGFSNILENWNQETKSKHLIIRIMGKLEPQDIEGLDNEYSCIQVKNCNNVTIEGIGNDTTLKGVGIIIEDSQNIEIRNLGIMLYIEDGISIKKNNKNIWIHNNDFFYGKQNNTDITKLKGDGAIDIKDSEYVTISYNHFWDTEKTSLCGLNNDLNYITYHHNWFDHCDSRCPLVSYASVHCYNNYYDCISNFGVGARDQASVFLESNYFVKCKRPMAIASQGSSTNSILKEKPGGIIKSYNNLIKKNINRIMLFSENPIDFDVYVVENRNDIVPGTCKTLKGNYIYNNFDTDEKIMYNYTLDEVNKVKNIVTNDSGRLQGGDIDFDTSKLSYKSRSRFDTIEQQLDNLILNY